MRVFFLFFRHQNDFSYIFKSFVGFYKSCCKRGVSDDFLNFGKERLISEVIPHFGMREKLLKNSVHVLILIFRDLKLLDCFDGLLKNFMVRKSFFCLANELMFLMRK